MTDYGLVYPMAAMFALTAVVLVVLFRRRVEAVRSGAISASYFRTFGEAVEPERSRVAARQFANLFEAPTLFYVACLVLMVVHDASPWARVFAWAYVAARVIHTVIHLGANRLRWRIRAFFASWIILAVLWGHLVAYVTFWADR